MRDRIIINDHSEAHGDKGKITHIQENGIILVELENGCTWPVTEDEIIVPAKADSKEQQ